MTSERKTVDNWIIVIASVAIFCVGLLPATLLYDPDTWWHIKTGEWIIANREVPRFDPFVARDIALPWIPHEWLSEVIFASVYNFSGWSGVYVISSFSITLTIFLSINHINRHLSGLSLFIFLLISISLVFIHYLARPHILTFPVIVLWVCELLRARDENRAPSYYYLPLMTLWANLHGGFAIGIALIGPFALEALLDAAHEKNWTVFRSWFIFGVGAVLAAACTPFGIEGLMFPFDLLKLDAVNYIDEWAPTSFKEISSFEMLLLTLIFALFYMKMSLPWTRALLVIGLISMALHHVRHQAILGLIAPLIIAPAVGSALQMPAASRRIKLSTKALFGVVCVLIILPSAIRLYSPHVPEDSPAFPIKAFASIPDDLKKKPLFNAYMFGGYLIWNGITPFIDGRAEMYRDARIKEYLEFSRGEFDGITSTLKARNITWAILRPNDMVRNYLKKYFGWREIYADEFAVIMVQGS